jgi:hypothetical protein
VIAATGGDISGTLPVLTINNSAVTGAKIASNTVTAGNIANRTRTVVVSGSQFIGLTTTSAFNWSSGNRGVAVRSFGSPNSAGQMTVSFQVPADYAGPSTGDLAAVPGIQAPRLRIKWVTDSAQANGSRKINMDVAWAQDDNLNGGNLTRFRYNIRANAAGSDAAESADPSNVQVATQVIPEAGDNWSTGEGPVVAWAPGQTIILTLARNTTDDPNDQRAGIISVSFEYDADQ